MGEYQARVRAIRSRGWHSDEVLGAAERIAAAADTRIAELEAAMPDPRVLENIAATRGQLNYDASDALRDAADAIRAALAATDVGAGTEGSEG